MSENKPELPYTRDSHPHTGDPRIDPQARVARSRPRRVSAAVQQRRTLERETMAPEGFFGSPQPAQPAEVVESEVKPPVRKPQPESRETPLKKAYRFIAGAPLFRVVRNERTKRIVIPGTWEKGDDMFMGRLPFSFELDMDSRYLEIGKEGKPVPIIVGKSTLGAFVVASVVDLGIIDEDGEPVEYALVDMRDRKLRRDNEVIRFRRETSGELYYLSLSGRSSRRGS
jgi:hypothetical protein